MLEILYQDEYLVAINKPHGLMVHRSKMAGNTDEFALQLLRDQIKQRVHPVHRLDRKTSGVLLFTLSQELVAPIQKQFAAHEVTKTYWAILRGYAPDSGEIDYALTNEKGTSQSAITHYKILARTEIPLPFGKFSTSRYSWVEAKPKTGRMHQLRKHFAHINHPIIGDRPHGCNKQNKLFLTQWNMASMLLHARQLELKHPITDQPIQLQATPSEEFKRMLAVLSFNRMSDKEQA